jgi:O-acetyl-ADP-ribose deacetylase (regulator of RNase III)
MNIRMPGPIGEDVLRVQDEYLRETAQQKGITALDDLTPVEPGIYLWQGDITTLEVDAIVNAANAQLLGCFSPSHGCIDNAIHTYAGLQLRDICNTIMRTQGHEERTGTAKLTPGFNLPATYVVHTVGPIVYGPLREHHEKLLASCYRSCLGVAEANGCKSIAFCCISTGVFRFPNRRAAEIAIETVDRYTAETGSEIDVIFNVWKEQDLAIYRALL